MKQNTLRGIVRRRGSLLLAVALSAPAACSDGPGPVDPDPNPSVTDVSLSTYGVQTIRGQGGVKFVNPGRYAVIPSFAAGTDFATGTNRSTVPDFPYLIGGGSSTVARIASAGAPAPSLNVVQAFHDRLREIEREEAPKAIAWMQQQKARGVVNAQVVSAQAADTRTFRVLSALTGGSYTTVTARLVFSGTNILLYVDEGAPTVNGFTDAEYQAFGQQFDTDLFPIDVSAFGATSDIDGNGKTFVLFTPIVNRLTLNTNQCGSYVAGFFNGADLSATNTNANRAEIFYASVPGEPAGGASCQTLSPAVVRTSAPATFIHELQHMISYNQHVLRRSASVEEVWLNEGLSHMAEELGGKLYEERFPCPNLPPCPPPGRTSTAQIFPDAAQGFLPPNFGNAYDFFSARQDFSLTSPTGFGTTEERGVAWLFLRWLVDQKGAAALAGLLQTSRVGVTNIEAVAAENFRVLFADFLAATLLDDYPGATAGQIPTRYQYSSRNLRAIYARLNAIAAGSYPTPYPLDVATVPTSNKLTPTSPLNSRVMKPGSLDLYEFQATAGSTLSFKPASGTFATNLNAQVTIVRLPN